MPKSPPPPVLSIIIPTLNEATTIVATLSALAALPTSQPVEIIVADGNSQDETLLLARMCGARTVLVARGRGTQMNAGAALARGTVLLFLHADTMLPTEAVAAIAQALAAPSVCGGNFQLRFSGNTWAARALTRIYPCLRWGGMCYGDSAMFVRRETFVQLGGYRDIPLFEDIDFYRRVRHLGKFVHLPATAITSARRFEGRFLRTFALWSCLQVGYWFGVPPNWLARGYRIAR